MTVATKHLDAAISLMENGWCVGDLKGKDAMTGKDVYCAVGAVAESAGVMRYLQSNGDEQYEYNEEDSAYWVDEELTYQGFRNLIEAKVLAALVMSDNDFLTNRCTSPEDITTAYGDGRWDEVVFGFNDESTKEHVIDLFKKARTLVG